MFRFKRKAVAPPIPTPSGVIAGGFDADAQEQRARDEDAERVCKMHLMPDINRALHYLDQGGTKFKVWSGSFKSKYAYGRVLYSVHAASQGVGVDLYGYHLAGTAEHYLATFYRQGYGYSVSMGNQATDGKETGRYAVRISAE